MFGRIRSLYRRLMEGTVYVQAPLKAFEMDERIVKEKYGIEIRELNYHSVSDISLWCSIINNSYEDMSFTNERAISFLTNHPYITENHTFVFCESDGKAIATVSIGLYRKNRNIGGDFKLGVVKDCQGKGYGNLCVLYAFSKLKSMGIQFGESAIRIKRIKSLYLHFSLGFRPQYNVKYLACGVPSARLKNWNLLFILKEKKIYKTFLDTQRIKFIH